MAIHRRRMMVLSAAALVGSRVAGLAQPDMQRLPAASTTRHGVELPGRTLQVEATAGSILLTDDKQAPRAELAFIAFQLDVPDRVWRPVTFAFNGGPGFASAWLNVGAVGPWRIALGNDTGASPDLLANAETWLDFTDLVFIDPAGTGFSRVLTSDPEARQRLWSVNGDIEYLAEAIRRWVVDYDRTVSPKYLLGESYGGFRVPRLARELSYRLSGMVMVSPALDLGGRSSAFAPFFYVTHLPSMAAAARAGHETVTRAMLAEVEHYATTEYLIDLTRGEIDADAVARRSERVAVFTGLDPALVRRHGGMIDNRVFLHELYRAQGRVGSSFDATITAVDPYPDSRREPPDPVLGGFRGPISSALEKLYAKLNWQPDGAYQLGNVLANHQWDWGRNVWNPPQSVQAMRNALSRDPQLKVLIGHGLFDLVTPYLGTQLLLDQLPQAELAGRVRFSVYAGGHMFYTNDASRAALRQDAAALFE
ncbi:MAG TPA: septum formation initiator [Acetobacteraceae bacterium]|nr:septum formation initiator [Acetobacteraceae bacterium]